MAAVAVGINNLAQDATGAFEQPIIVELRAGETLVIVGPNGVGKSALIEEMGRGLRSQSDTEQFSGYRQIHFQNDDVENIGLSLDQLKTQLANHEHVTRARNPWGEQHLKSVIRRIINRQIQDEHDFVAAVRGGQDIVMAESDHAIILDEINGIFEAGRLAVRIIMDGGFLKVNRGGAIYGIDRMSDGERAALLLVGAILIRPNNSRITIDEPERHLNPAISGPLIGAAIRARPDLGFVFSTHDLDLLAWLSPAKILHVSDSVVISEKPETRRYKLDVVSSDAPVSNELRGAIFGSRRALLLVEGSESSSDEALFGLIYAGWNVKGRGGWESVANEVRGINNSSNYHWLHVAGLVDGDGRDEHELEQLAGDSIFALPFPTIENLMFYKPVVEAMVALKHSIVGGASVEDRMTEYGDELRRAVSRAKDEIVNRRVVWRANRALSEKKVSVRSIRDGQESVDGLDLIPLREAVLKEVEEAIAGGAIEEIVTKVPIKNTGVPGRLSAVIGFADFEEYTQAILNQLQTVSPTGKAIKTALADVLPDLPERA